MAVFDELHAGSFRGAVFYVSSATTSGGRKQVTHEYPYSDRQKVEDLGFKPRNFKISAIIPNETASDPRGYIQKRDELLAALEQGGNGTLSHPFFSNDIQVTAKPYTLTESMQSIGKGTIELEFDYSNVSTDPQRQDTSLSQINAGYKSVMDQIVADVEDFFRVNSPLNYEAAVSKLSGLADAFDTGTKIYNQVTSKISSYNRVITGFRDDITQMIGAPATVAMRVGSLMVPVAGLYNDAATTSRVSRGFFSFGDDDPVIEPTTVQRAQRKLNNEVLTYAVKAGMLATAYQSISEIDFPTVDAVQETQDVLDAQYQDIVNSNVVSDDMFTLLLSLRAQVNQYLEAVKLTAPEVIEVEIKELPLSVIAFQYYGYEPDLDTLINDLVPVNAPQSNDLTFMQGSALVVSNG